MERNNKDQSRNKWNRILKKKKDVKDQLIQTLVLENINKIEKPLTRLIKNKNKNKNKNLERTQINKIRNERGEITIDTN